MNNKIIDKVFEYINSNYDVLEEKPWKKYPEFITFKHKSNNKWFALFMNVSYDKLKIEKSGNVEVLNLKNIPEFIGALREKSGIYPAYHMNKEHWITVLLDESISIDEIKELIDISYDLTKK